MKYLAIIFSVFLFNECFSQKKTFAELNSDVKLSKNDTSQINSLYHLAIDYYFPAANIDSLKSISKKINNVNKKLQWQKGQYLTFIIDGAIAKLNGNFYEATQIYLKALQIAEKNQNIHFMSKCNFELGNCYSLLLQYHISIPYYKKAIVFSKSINNKELLGWCLNNLAQDYSDSNYFLASKDCYDQALSVFNEINLIDGKANVFENLGTLYYLQSDFIKAEKYQLQANELFLKLKRNYLIANNYVKLANTYFSQNLIEKSIFYCNKSIEISKKNQYLSLLIQTHEILYKCFKNKGNSSLALDNFEKKTFYLSKNDQKESDRKIRSLKYEYENTKQLEVNRLQKNELNLQKKVNIILILSIVAFIVFAIVLLNNNIKINKQNKQIAFQKDEINELNLSLEKKVSERTQELFIANEELIKKNTEIEDAVFNGQKIERRRFASELHDNLGSTLSAVKWRLEAINKENLIPKEQKLYDSIITTLKNVYSEVRLISHNLLPAELESEGLIGALTKLTDDINNSGKVLIHIKSNFLILDKKIEFELYNILMEVLNNILKHSQATFVKIDFEQSKNIFQVLIKDNGVGFDTENSSNGVGLQNIRNRVESINAHVTFKSELNNGTQIIISMPL